MDRRALTRVARVAVPQVSSAAALTAVPVLLATGGNLAAAAWIATAGSAGAVVGAVGAVPLTRVFPALVRGPLGPAVVLACWLASVSSLLLFAVAGLPNAGIGAVLAATGGATWTVLSSLNRGVVSSWGDGWLRRVGSVGRVGAAVGALIGATCASVSFGPYLVLACLPGVGFCTALTQRERSARRPHAWHWSVFLENVLLALAGYGPLVLHVAFVAVTAGPGWAGVSMVVYAGFALAAAPLVRRLPSRWHATPAAWLTLAAVADASWLLTVLHPVVGLLASRALSALTIMAAEGSSDVSANRRGGLAAAQAGRAVGGVAAGVAGAALFTASHSIMVTTGVFTSVAVLAALAFRFRSARQLRLDR